MNLFPCRRFSSKSLPVAIVALALPMAVVAFETSDAQTPLRPLPEARDREFGSGPGYFVDPRNGADANAGSRERPWRTIGHAVQRLSAGETLYLRGGTYYERLNLTKSGRPKQPITIRAFPGELPILDGGIREFYENPGDAWEPYPNGAPGEFRSTREYSAGELDELTGKDDEDSEEPAEAAPERPSQFFKKNVHVRGWFAPSMIPVRGYTELDFRSDNVFWNLRGGKHSLDEGIYFGPGVWYDRETRRIHIRLAPTSIPGITNYAGETDPRKLSLVIAVRPPGGPQAGVSEDGGPRAGVLNLHGARHWKFQDLVVRGSADALINIDDSDDIELDHLTVYGAPGLSAARTNRLRIVHSAFRGLTSPWESRASMKYRGAGAYIIRHANERGQLTSRDWEVANCEITDSHDGFWMLGIKNLKFHRNYVHNFNDDGLEVGPKVKGQEIYIYENLISRTSGTLALHGVGNNPRPGKEWRNENREVEPDSGVYVFRNVFDLRGKTYRTPPRKPEAGGEGKAEHWPVKLTRSHGSPSPVYPQIYFYHNTVFHSGQPASFVNSYGFGIGSSGAIKSKRRVFNNIFVQMKGRPAMAMTEGGKAKMRPDLDAEVDGNLIWGVQANVSPPPESERRRGWMERDIFADPKFFFLPADPMQPLDLRLRRDSPAVDTGIAIPSRWPDSLRDADAGVSDRGAIPAGAIVPRIGVDGRLSIMPEEPST